MKLIDLLRVSPRSFVFVKDKSGKVHEAVWGLNGKGYAALVDHKDWSDKAVTDVRATKYPMYDSVLEVTVA